MSEEDKVSGNCHYRRGHMEGSGSGNCIYPPIVGSSCCLYWQCHQVSSFTSFLSPLTVSVLTPLTEPREDLWHSWKISSQIAAFLIHSGANFALLHSIFCVENQKGQKSEASLNGTYGKSLSWGIIWWPTALPYSSLSRLLLSKLHSK